jgi:hypothetical protein
MSGDKLFTYETEISSVIDSHDEQKLSYKLFYIKNTKRRILITIDFVYLEIYNASTDIYAQENIESKKFDRKELFENPIEWKYEIIWNSDKIIKYKSINTADYNTYINPKYQL